MGIKKLFATVSAEDFREDCYVPPDAEVTEESVEPLEAGENDGTVVEVTDDIEGETVIVESIREDLDPDSAEEPSTNEQPVDNVPEQFDAPWSIENQGELEEPDEERVEEFERDEQERIEYERRWGANVIVYADGPVRSEWEGYARDRLNHCTVSFSSDIAQESLQLDEHALSQLKAEVADSLKVHVLPSEQTGFKSEHTLLEAGMEKPDQIIVVSDPSNLPEAEQAEVKEYETSLAQRGALVVKTSQEAVAYIAGYLP